MAAGIPVIVTYDAEGNPVGNSLKRSELRPRAVTHLKEHVLQAIIDQHPDLLPYDEFFPAATTLCSLGREIPVDLGERIGERGGYIDNLLVTDDGHLVLVETKLWRNPEAVRDVIAQVMEYAMAIGSLGLHDLERAIRRGDPKGRRLAAEESIAKRIQRTAGGSTVAEDFEDAFTRFRQTGELLVLIVADGIRTSVERLTKWFGEQLAPGSPIRLGLVELRFYEAEGKHLVVPVVRLRTKEVGRHTVVVEVKEGTASSIAVSVRDAGPDQPLATRKIGRQEAMLTRDRFLARVRAAISGRQLQAIEQVVLGLDELGLATRGTSTTWQYGLTVGTSVLALVALAEREFWSVLPARLRALLGDERFVECKRVLNGVAAFFRPEDVDDPAKVSSLGPKYDVLIGREEEFIRAIAKVAGIARTALAEQS